MQDTCIQQHVVCCTLITTTCTYRNFATRTHGQPHTAKFRVQRQQRDANMSTANFHVDTCYMALPLAMSNYSVHDPAWYSLLPCLCGRVTDHKLEFITYPN